MGFTAKWGCLGREFSFFMSVWGIWHYLCHEGTVVTVMSSAERTGSPPQPTSIMAWDDPGSVSTSGRTNLTIPIESSHTDTPFILFFTPFAIPSQAKPSHQPQHSHIPILISWYNKTILGITGLPAFTPPATLQPLLLSQALQPSGSLSYERNSAASQNP